MTQLSDDEYLYFRADQAAARLDQLVHGYLCCRGIHISRSQLKISIDQGCILINGSSATKAGMQVRPGDLVEIRLRTAAPTCLEPYDFPLNILFEDAALIVLNKPVGISMHPGAGQRTQTLANALVAHFRAAGIAGLPGERPGIVHRLDKDTSGIVVVAKNLPVHEQLSKQFKERSTSRRYMALVLTTPRGRRAVQLQSAGVIDAPVGRHPGKRVMMSVVGSGRKAVTNWRTIDLFLYGALVELKLQTGRTHQIRVHMNHIGSPVIGDPLYGNMSALPAELRELAKEFGRQVLHADSLGFTHPLSGERMEFTADPPEDFQKLVDCFRGYGGR